MSGIPEESGPRDLAQRIDSPQTAPLVALRIGTDHARAKTEASSRSHMLKILRTVDGSSVVFVLSGRIEAEHLGELQRLLDAEEHDTALDLNEVTLVDRDTIQFLARCEADRVQLRNCPAYVRKWLQRAKHWQ
jgi:hypothetical protein